MRKIKFRGKRVDNGGWVAGYYFQTPLTDESTGSKPEDGWCFLAGRERHCISRDSCVYEVISETVSQFTGLRDKNGKEIYEGDIFRDGEKLYIVVWLGFDAGFSIVELKDWLKYKNNDINPLVYEGLGSIRFAREIIGNIHDNPELLEVPHA